MRNISSRQSSVGNKISSAGADPNSTAHARESFSGSQYVGAKFDTNYTDLVGEYADLLRAYPGEASTISCESTFKSDLITETYFEHSPALLPYKDRQGRILQPSLNKDNSLNAVLICRARGLGAVCKWCRGSSNEADSRYLQGEGNSCAYRRSSPLGKYAAWPSLTSADRCVPTRNKFSNLCCRWANKLQRRSRKVTMGAQVAMLRKMPDLYDAHL